MRLYLGIAIGLLLGIGVMLFVPHGAPQIVYAGSPSGNGDVNASGAIDIADAIYLLTYLFAKGPVPEPIQSGDPQCQADLASVTAELEQANQANTALTAQVSDLQAQLASCIAGQSCGLPATGQTKCHTMSGSEVACNDPNVPGQDGYYQKGCPTENRFIDNQDGTVTDTCTGLMWQKDTADINGDGTYTREQDRVTWQQALQYCESLEFAGHSDWRLPNVRELQSIVDYGRYGPSIDPVFSVWAESWWYWSSSTGAGHPDYAWGVDFVGGSVPVDYKGVGGCVRAVRG